MSKISYIIIKSKKKKKKTIKNLLNTLELIKDVNVPPPFSMEDLNSLYCFTKSFDKQNERPSNQFPLTTSSVEDNNNLEVHCFFFGGEYLGTNSSLTCSCFRFNHPLSFGVASDMSPKKQKKKIHEKTNYQKNSNKSF